MGKPAEQRLLGNLRLRWECVKMGLEEVGWGGVEWIALA